MDDVNEEQNSEGCKYRIFRLVAAPKYELQQQKNAKSHFWEKICQARCSAAFTVNAIHMSDSYPLPLF